MSNSKRVLIPLIVILMLILQLMSPVAVLADDETPPDPPAATEDPPPPEETTGTEEASVEEVTPTGGEEVADEPVTENAISSEVGDVSETLPADGTSLPEESMETEEEPASEPTEEPAPEPEVISSLQEEDLSVAEALEQAPEGTEIVIVNNEGQVEPLVTEEAAEITANADPIWCPDGQAPTPGANGCTVSYTSLQDLLNYLDANEPSQAGTIWIEDSYNSSVNDSSVSGFTIDGATLTTMSAYDLTVQGGWSGANGSTAITGTSTFNGDYLYITNWNASVTLMDIVVTGAADTGIQVQTTGEINLHNVASNSNRGDGADLISVSDITVFNSQFNGNDGSGLLAFSLPLAPDSDLGNITLNQVTANANGFDGVDLLSFGDITVSNSQFNENDELGILAGDFLIGFFGVGLSNAAPAQEPLLSGSITLNQVTANGNGLDGANLLSFGDIKVSNSHFNGNDGFGLCASFLCRIGLPPVITSAITEPDPLFPFSGNITLNQVTASANGLGGAILESTGNINIFNGQFNGNGVDAVPDCWDDLCAYYPPFGGIGLAASSWLGTGQIRLDNVQSWFNYGDGAFLIGDDVVVLNSTFIGNGLGLPPSGYDLWADGLYIEHVFNSSAYVECTKAIGNASYGMEIITGDITLNSASAFGNGWDDFYFESDTLNVLSDPCGKDKKKELPWRVIPVIGDESIELNCLAYIGTVLVLPNGDEIRLPCPTIGNATLESVLEDDLPGNIPEGNSYVSSFTAQVIQDGASLDTLPASMIVSFLIPEDMLDADLAILYWNGTEWVEVAGAYKTADGRFEATVNFTGTFILVSK